MNIRKINWLIIQKLNKRFRTTIFDEIYWRYRRCRGDWRDNKSYLDSVDHPHRKAILDIISTKYNRGFSLLEIGSNAGPNLIAIKSRFPFTRLAGIDINKKAVREGKKEGLDIIWGKADKLPFKDNEFDIILADAVLMYIGPDKIAKVIQEMIRVAKNMIVIVDFHKQGSFVFSNMGFDTDNCIELGHWVRDYQILFETFGLEAEVRETTKEEWPGYSWEKLGHYITVWMN